MERLHRTGLTAADMWCLDSERRNTDGPPGISFRLLQVFALVVDSPLGCQDDPDQLDLGAMHICQYAQNVEACSCFS